MTSHTLLRKHRLRILQLAAKRGAQNVRIFGSVVRGEDDTGSDIDFLVHMTHGRSLLDLVGLNIDLEELLRRKVDVVDEEALSPYIRDRILAEASPL